MSETNTAAVPASIGAPQRLNVNIPVDSEVANPDENANANNSNDGQSQEDKDKAAEALKLAEAEKNKLPEVNDDQLKEMLKSRGIDFENFDTLKEKLKPVAAEQTPEEKLKAEADFEKRRIDLFLTQPGATVEGYAAMKNLLNAPDLKEISITEIRQSMKGKFDESQIEAVIQERYYQKNPDELPQDKDETDDDFELRKADYKKKHDYGTEKILAGGQAIKDKATRFFNTLDTAIKQSDLSQKAADEQERKLLSTTDEHLSKVQKEITYELGKALDESDIAPVPHKVDDADIAEVSALLKDKTLREKTFITTEGELNVQALADLLLENKTLKKGLKAAYLEGGSRQVAHFREVFPMHSAAAVGVGSNGSNQNKIGQKGTPASFGKAKRVPANG